MRREWSDVYKDLGNKIRSYIFDINTRDVHPHLRIQGTQHLEYS